MSKDVKLDPLQGLPQPARPKQIITKKHVVSGTDDAAVKEAVEKLQADVAKRSKNLGLEGQAAARALVQPKATPAAPQTIEATQTAGPAETVAAAQAQKLQMKSQATVSGGTQKNVTLPPAAFATPDKKLLHSALQKMGTSSENLAQIADPQQVQTGLSRLSNMGFASPAGLSNYDLILLLMRLHVEDRDLDAAFRKASFTTELSSKELKVIQTEIDKNFSKLDKVLSLISNVERGIGSMKDGLQTFRDAAAKIKEAVAEQKAETANTRLQHREAGLKKLVEGANVPTTLGLTHALDTHEKLPVPAEEPATLRQAHAQAGKEFEAAQAAAKATPPPADGQQKLLAARDNRVQARDKLIEKFLKSQDPNERAELKALLDEEKNDLDELGSEASFKQRADYLIRLQRQLNSEPGAPLPGGAASSEVEKQLDSQLKQLAADEDSDHATKLDQSTDFNKLKGFVPNRLRLLIAEAARNDSADDSYAKERGQKVVNNLKQNDEGFRAKIAESLKELGVLSGKREQLADHARDQAYDSFSTREREKENRAPNGVIDANARLYADAKRAKLSGPLQVKIDEEERALVLLETKVPSPTPSQVAAQQQKIEALKAANGSAQKSLQELSGRLFPKGPDGKIQETKMDRIVALTSTGQIDNAKAAAAWGTFASASSAYGEALRSGDPSKIQQAHSRVLQAEAKLDSLAEGVGFKERELDAIWPTHEITLQDRAETGAALTTAKQKKLETESQRDEALALRATLEDEEKALPEKSPERAKKSAEIESNKKKLAELEAAVVAQDRRVVRIADRAARLQALADFESRLPPAGAKAKDVANGRAAASVQLRNLVPPLPADDAKAGDAADLKHAADLRKFDAALQKTTIISQAWDGDPSAAIGIPEISKRSPLLLAIEIADRQEKADLEVLKRLPPSEKFDSASVANLRAYYGKITPALDPKNFENDRKNALAESAPAAGDSNEKKLFVYACKANQLHTASGAVLEWGQHKYGDGWTDAALGDWAQARNQREGARDSWQRQEGSDAPTPEDLATANPQRKDLAEKYFEAEDNLKIAEIQGNATAKDARNAGNANAAIHRIKRQKNLRENEAVVLREPPSKARQATLDRIQADRAALEDERRNSPDPEPKPPDVVPQASASKHWLLQTLEALGTGGKYLNDNLDLNRQFSRLREQYEQERDEAMQKSASVSQLAKEQLLHATDGKGVKWQEQLQLIRALVEAAVKGR